jgi:hypothetical protein
MNELIEIFMTSPLHQQIMLVFWGICVVTFYSVVTYTIGNVMFNTLKSFVK